MQDFLQETVKTGRSGLETFLIGAGAVAFFTAFWWGVYRLAHNQRSVSWERAVRGVKSAAEEMKADGFEPSVVVGVGRGGAVLAALMGGHFRDVFVLTSRRRRGGASYSVENGGLPGAEKLSAILAALAAAPPAGPDKIGAGGVSVLVIADTAYEGSTFEKYLEFLGEHKGLHVRTFAYAVQPRGRQFSDYKVLETKNRLKFPWTEPPRKRGRDLD